MPLLGCWHRKHWIFVPLWPILVWLFLGLRMSLADRNWRLPRATGPLCGCYKVIEVFWDRINFPAEQEGPSSSRETADQHLILFSPFSLWPLLVYFWNMLPASWYPKKLVSYRVFSALIPIVGKPYRNSTFIFTACLWGGRILWIKNWSQRACSPVFFIACSIFLVKGKCAKLISQIHGFTLSERRLHLVLSTGKH